MNIQELCLWMGQVEASDLHLKDGRPPLVRIHGEIKPFDLPNLSGSYIESLLTPIMSNRLLKQFAETFEADFSYSLPDEARFRINMFRQRGVVGAVFRRIPLKVPTSEELGLSETINRLADQENGLVLVTGPTGSGKSTTLAAMLERINRTRPVHIMTIEDPIEFVYEDKVAIINQRELGIDTVSLDAALKSVLRQDPDIILMGEIRDRQTVGFALTAAETGHLVFATLHTNNAVQTLERILDMTPSEVREAVRTQLSLLLRGVVCQRLVAKAGGGRLAAQEILVGNETIQQLVAENKFWDIEKAIEAGNYYGMQTFNQAFAALVEKGLVTREIAIANSGKPVELELLFKGVRGGSGYDGGIAPQQAEKDGSQLKNAISFGDEPETEKGHTMF
ncbi:MAG: type IV pilus twitching motility protein PilT [Planctomycetota bacterium]|jgi:twitching motility protein PilT|nr:type IV pilus twitching motility protein PilT [Planctomycetota bacterium]